MKTGLLFKIAFFIFCLPFYGVGQVTYVVNTTDNYWDGVCDDLHCSLEDALYVNQMDYQPSNIHFNIPGNGPFIINVNYQLPTLDFETIIDATTQPNYDSVGFIVLKATTRISYGLEVAPYSKIYGLTLDGFDVGLYVNGGNAIIGAPGKGNLIYNSRENDIKLVSYDNLIQGNFLGTNRGGNTSAIANGGGGISVEGGRNTIGGDRNLGEGNIIGGHSQHLIELYYNNIIDIRGNNLGIGKDGISNLQSGINGILILRGSENATIGGENGSENLIGNVDYGIHINGIETEDINIEPNQFNCINNKSINFSPQVVNQGNPPVIDTIKINRIEGRSVSNSKINLYKSNNECNVGCETFEYLKSTTASATGYWHFDGLPFLESNFGFVATANLSNYGPTSEFSNCIEYNYNTYQVNSTNDIDDGDCNSVHCSLREAINSANNDNIPSKVSFNLQGNSPFIISLSSTLPNLTEDQTIIDASTQIGYNSPGHIIISGNNQVSNCFDVISSYNEIYALQFSDFIDYGIRISGDNNKIGSIEKGNIFNNIKNSSIDNYAVELLGNDNIFQSNLLGTTSSGNITTLNNGNNGLLVEGSSNQIGGDRDLNEGNIFGGFSNNNIIVSGSNHKIYGNNIGVGKDETSSLDNSENGIHFIGSSSVTIGGDSTFKNLIAYNDNGINIDAVSEKINILENSFFCNNLKGVNIENGGNNNKLKPIILGVYPQIITGTASPNDNISIYKKGNNLCTSVCEGNQLIATTTADINGYWNINEVHVLTDINFRNSDLITVIASSSTGNSSEFSDCYYQVDTTYLVNSIDDANDGICNTQHCSLREAVIASNSDNVPSKIHFNISGTGPFEIVLDSMLPYVEEPYTIIDATTQPSYNEMDYIRLIGKAGYNPEERDTALVFTGNFIELYGLNITDFYVGLRLDGNYCQIGKPNKGNLFELNNRFHIYIWKGDYHKIESNHIGVDKTGLIIRDSISSDRIYGFRAEFSTIGGRRSLNQGNVIGGWRGENIHFEQSTGSFIHGNNIGVGLDGETKINNSADGIYLSSQNYYNNFGYIVGDTDLDFTNLIMYNNIGVEQGSLYGDIYLYSNKIKHNSTGISLAYTYNGNNPVKIRQNEFKCNNIGISGASNVYKQWYIDPPQISFIDENEITGLSVSGDTIEVYLSGDSCAFNNCEGEQFIGTVITLSDGTWSIPTPEYLKLGDRITATATNTNHTSLFAPCKTVLPTDCKYAQPLPMNNQACSSVGIVLDLKELTNSTSLIASDCETTFAGNDAWYKVIVPDSGNFLIRTNVNNTVTPVIGLYTDCSQGPLPECSVLDSLPYVMIFENYTPGDTLLLRVWDKDNTIVNSVGSALLHLTAHKLPIRKSDWEICDYENLEGNNPTNLIRKEANNFILEYEEGTTPEEISKAIDTLENIHNLELMSECSCGGQPVQLWAADNPIKLESLKQRAKKRGNVDTTNYNYVFETVEFQVNSYAIGQQYETDIAMNAEGNFVMVWKDEQRRHNYGRVYLSSGNPISVEFPVGNSEKTQYNTSVAIKDNGEFIVVWHEVDPTVAGASFEVYGRLYHADGTRNGDAFNISKTSAYTYTNTDSEAQNNFRELARKGTNAKVAVNSDGSFIVVWQAGGSVFAQRYTETANLIDKIIEVGGSTNTDFNPVPNISVNISGQFMVTWVGQDADQKGVYAQGFDNNGIPIADAFLVNTTEENTQCNPDITLFNDGSFVATWESFEQLSGDSDYDIYAQRFDANGTKIGAEFLVNSYVTDAQKSPSIARFNNGNFLIAWSSNEQDGFAEGIYAKIFNASGIAIEPSFADSLRGSIGEEFRMNTYNDPRQDKPQTATNGENLFMGAWEDGQNDGDQEGIFAQRYETIKPGATRVFYPIGTATPSTLLGDQKTYDSPPYNPGDAVKKVKVAIIDTGVDSSHNLLNAAIWKNPEINDSENCLIGDEIGYDFVNKIGIPIDLDGHGTQVNGILTDSIDTNIKLELMNLKFHERDKGSVFDAICAIYYAVDNGANILNLSWGFEASEEPTILKKALQYASDKDVLIITTAGNTSKNNDLINKYPANLDIPNMIVVTSYHYKQATNEYKLSNYASYGQNNVDIAAYGYVETASIDGGTTEAAGTSMAAPAVARTAAIIKGLYPILTASEIKDCILTTATFKSNLSNRVASKGILNHIASLDCAETKAEMVIENACTISGLLIDTSTVGACNASEGTINLSFTGIDPSPTFLWSTGDTTQNLSNLAAGNYSVTVTDTARCEQTLDIIITNDCESNCQTNLVLNEVDMNSAIYQSDNTITSSGTVEIDSNVVFKAAESVTLTNGFHAKSGSDFLASIENCISSLGEEIAESRLNSTIHENSELSAKIYPNPTRERLNIEVIKTGQGFNLELYDVIGRQLNVWEIATNQTYIEVNHLNSGIYFLRIDNELIQKFIVDQK